MAVAEISSLLESMAMIMAETGLAGLVEVLFNFFSARASVIVSVLYPFGEGNPRVQSCEQ